MGCLQPTSPNKKPISAGWKETLDFLIFDSKTSPAKKIVRVKVKKRFEMSCKLGFK